MLGFPKSKGGPDGHQREPSLHVAAHLAIQSGSRGPA